MYGWGHNEELLGRALKGTRDKVVIVTKFGQVRSPGGANGVNGRPEYVRQACDASLKRLGMEVIDLYYQHRVDPNVPVEDTVGEMRRLVERGKVRFIGLCEAHPRHAEGARGAPDRGRAERIFAALPGGSQRDARRRRDLGISFVAYAPLGRSLLAGVTRPGANLAEGDTRARHPRFEGENFEKNRALVERVEAMAADKECTVAQLSLAWLLAQGKDVLPIPGTKRIERLEENLAALDVELTQDGHRQHRRGSAARRRRRHPLSRGWDEGGLRSSN